MKSGADVLSAPDFFKINAHYVKIDCQLFWDML